VQEVISFRLPHELYARMKAGYKDKKHPKSRSLPNVVIRNMMTLTPRPSGGQNTRRIKPTTSTQGSYIDAHGAKKQQLNILTSNPKERKKNSMT
jgi:hypothetical protein